MDDQIIQEIITKIFSLKLDWVDIFFENEYLISYFSYFKVSNLNLGTYNIIFRLCCNSILKNI